MALNCISRDVFNDTNCKLRSPLGASTWCFNGLMPEPIARVLDGGALLTAENKDGVRAYFAQLSNSILSSRIHAVELWYSEALFDDKVMVSLEEMATEGVISSMHGPFGPSRDLSSSDDEVRVNGVTECKKAARLLSELGGKVLVLHGSSAVSDGDSLIERIWQSAKSLSEIAEFCGGLGIFVAVEHLSGLAVGCTSDDLVKLVELVGRPNIGTCLDTNHVFPPARLVAATLQLGHTLLTLHVSDYDGQAERHWLPGEGVIDWHQFMFALNEVGYQGPFLYESRFEASSIEDAVSKIERNYEGLIKGLPS